MRIHRGRLFMWSIANNTPYAADRAWLRDPLGRDVWLVAVKATFEVRGTSSVLASDQLPVLHAAQYRDDPANSSIVYPEDFVLDKAAVDILVVGDAVTTEPSTETFVSLRIGKRPEKKLRVIGDRVWQRGMLGMRLSSPTPFRTMPICYERAFGGADEVSGTWEERNPIGRGWRKNAAQVPNTKAPN
ncbi:MAG TPA: DUF2169 domain-containing protein, partial [Sorangium sp.]|nr:DUF2169 domain-containing protein [Sorangium sp.]